jgi:hypothetical protein
MATYKKTLLTAREEADRRLAEKGLDYKVRSVGGTAAEDDELLTGGLVKRRNTPTEEESTDLMTEYFVKLRAENQKLKKGLAEGVSLRPQSYSDVMSRLSKPEKAEALKSDPAFAERLNMMMEKYPGLTENEIFKVIEGESAYNPKAVSSAGAVTLFQFTPEVAGELGFTTEELKAMEPAEQLAVYDSYLSRWDYDGSYGLGIMQAAPAYRKASSDTVIYKKGSKEWKQNPGWRSFDNGDITKESIEAYYGRVK